MSPAVFGDGARPTACRCDGMIRPGYCGMFAWRAQKAGKGENLFMPPMRRAAPALFAICCAN